MSTSNRSPPIQNQDEDQAPDIEPEIGEGGPRDRGRAFMEQRLTVLRPREAPLEEPVTEDSPDQPPPEDQPHQIETRVSFSLGPCQDVLHHEITNQ